MLRSCAYCGRIHDSKHDCGKRPVKHSKRTSAELGRYSYAFEVKSKQIKERSHYLCAYCLLKGKFNSECLETHHIVKLRERPDLLLEDSNLICLCYEHHKQADQGRIDSNLLQKLACEREKDTPLPCCVAEI